MKGKANLMLLNKFAGEVYVQGCVIRS